ncbi:MAG TPA: GDSL-type esterase/lipase family protein [Methylomirabilota bacterium]|nr:GDSL-type esterase/lipase family protein [Methylomirabilota bacterium]
MISWRRRAAYVAVLLVAALAAAEGLLRAWYPAPARHFVWPPNLRVDFEPTDAATPGVTGRGRFRTNSLGLRADEPPAGPARIVYVLGGSTAADLYLDQEEAWVSLVQQGLNRDTAAPRTWVGNLARPSLASVHSLIHFDRLLPELPRADLLVNLVGVNDLQLALKSSYLAAPTRETHLAWAFALRPPEGGFWSRLATIRAARFAWLTWRRARLGLVQTRTAEGYARLRQCRQTAPPAKLVDVLPDLAPGLAEYRRNIVALAERARAYGAPMLFLTQPTLWAEEMPPDAAARLLAGGIGPIKTWCTHRRYFSPRALAQGMRAFNDVLRDVCRSPGMACRDLAAAVPPRAEYFYDDMHLSEAGARLVAGRVIDWILELQGMRRPAP